MCRQARNNRAAFCCIGAVRNPGVSDDPPVHDTIASGVLVAWYSLGREERPEQPRPNRSLALPSWIDAKPLLTPSAADSRRLSMRG